MTAASDPAFATRCLVAAAALAVYGAGASWLVRREGHAYRESLRVAAEARAVPPAPAREPRVPEVGRAARPAVDSPIVAGPERPGVVGPASPDLSASASAGPPAPGLPEGEPLADPLWAAPEVERAWDLDRMTVEDEIRLGRDLNALILALNPPTEGGPWGARLQQAADALREKAPRSELPYTFTVLESDAFNAFSHPGGFVYVTRGLLDAIGEDEPYALQFVLAHEMAHVELRHALRCLAAPDMRRLAGLGTVEALYKLVIPLAYPDEMDYEADRWALERMTELGHGRRESLAFLRKLEAHARGHGYPGGRGRPDPRVDGSVLDNHVRAHVNARSRLERAKKLVDGGPAPSR